MALEREDLESYVTLLRQDISRVETGINSRLDTLNSKTATNTTDIAVLKATSSEAKNTARNHGASWGGTAGAIIGGAIIAVYQYFNK